MVQCIVCASIQDDNLQALAIGLSPAQTQKTYNNFSYCTSMHLHFLQYEILDLIYLSLASFL